MGYDRFSAYSIRNRNGQVIDLESPVPPTKGESERRMLAQVKAGVYSSEQEKQETHFFRLWQAARMQKSTEFHYEKLISHDKYLYFVLWSGNEYYFFEFDWLKKFQRRSREYDRASYLKHLNGTSGVPIRWDETLSLDTPYPKAASPPQGTIQPPSS